MPVFKHSLEYFPGGVNSPARAFNAVGCRPPAIVKGKGAFLYDDEGNRYLDFVCSWGPHIFGHNHPAIVSALREMLRKGTSFGAVTPYELELAKLVRKYVPSLEKMRFVNSGTEATMSALRVARGFTGREYIVKFEGCYHGHADSLLVKAGSGLTTLGTPSSPGVPKAVAELTLTAKFNSPASVERLFSRYRNRIAAVIVEPVPGNMGVVVPQPGFLEFLREITRKHKTLLIFDEVMSGFRVSRGGAQQLYGVTPDLTTLGKIIGGGLPVGCYGGRKDIMSKVSPDGPIYQAGTLSGNPLCMAAGIATLELLSKKSVYRELEKKGRFLEKEIQSIKQKTRADIQFNRVGSMFTLFFNRRPVTDYTSATRSDTDRFARYFRFMLKNGVYLPCSQFEANFICYQHTNTHIEKISRLLQKFLASDT